MEATQDAIVDLYSDQPGVEAPKNGSKQNKVNVNSVERFVSTIAGSALAYYGWKRRDPGGYASAAVGLALLHRGATGHCYVYKALNADTSHAQSGPGDRGFRVEKSITVNKAPEVLFQAWRNFEQLPNFMTHLVSVEQIDDKKSHWIAKAPFGKTVSWGAEIINEKENELIAWQSLPGADVDSAGSVRFQALPEGRGTVVTVELSYAPPAGVAGMTVAKLLGEEPAHQIEDDLPRFKHLMEAGELPTTHGQSSAREAS